jgi:hypothetical protein
MGTFYLIFKYLPLCTGALLLLLLLLLQVGHHHLGAALP